MARLAIRVLGLFQATLDRASIHGFHSAKVRVLLDAEPNCLGSAFRQTLCHLTNGHALFTIELLRGMRG